MVPGIVERVEGVVAGRLKGGCAFGKQADKLGAPQVDARQGKAREMAQPLVLVVCQSQAPRCGLFVCVCGRRRVSLGPLLMIDDVRPDPMVQAK